MSELVKIDSRRVRKNIETKELGGKVVVGEGDDALFTKDSTTQVNIMQGKSATNTGNAADILQPEEARRHSENGRSRADGTTRLLIQLGLAARWGGLLLKFF